MHSLFPSSFPFHCSFRGNRTCHIFRVNLASNLKFHSEELEGLTCLNAHSIHYLNLLNLPYDLQMFTSYLPYEIGLNKSIIITLCIIRLLTQCFCPHMTGTPSSSIQFINQNRRNFTITRNRMDDGRSE